MSVLDARPIPSRLYMQPLYYYTEYIIGEKVSYSLYYSVVAPVQGHDLYYHIHVSQFTQGTPAHSHVASHRHDYDYRGHDLSATTQ